MYTQPSQRYVDKGMNIIYTNNAIALGMVRLVTCHLSLDDLLTSEKVMRYPLDGRSRTKSPRVPQQTLPASIFHNWKSITASCHKN